MKEKKNIYTKLKNMMSCESFYMVNFLFTFFVFKPENKPHYNRLMMRPVSCVVLLLREC